MELQIADHGFYASFKPLDIPYCNGAYCDNEYGNEALYNALERFRIRYPEVHYNGYIGYSWSDSHGGESIEHTVSSEKESVDLTSLLYDSVGKGLASAVVDDKFWEQMDYVIDSDGSESILKVFLKYEKWLPDNAIDKLLDFAEEYDGGSRKELEDLLLVLENSDEEAQAALE